MNCIPFVIKSYIVSYQIMSCAHLIRFVQSFFFSFFLHKTNHFFYFLLSFFLFAIWKSRTQVSGWKKRNQKTKNNLRSLCVEFWRIIYMWVCVCVWRQCHKYCIDATAIAVCWEQKCLNKSREPVNREPYMKEWIK